MGGTHSSSECFTPESPPSCTRATRNAIGARTSSPAPAPSPALGASWHCGTTRNRWDKDRSEERGGKSPIQSIDLIKRLPQLVERCWELGLELNVSDSQVHDKLRESIQEFNEFVGLQHTLAPTWTFWNSMFLAGQTMGGMEGGW